MNPYSVVITHYQREGNLGNTLKGLSQQTVTPSEIIVVDMGNGPALENGFPFEITVVDFLGSWQFMPLAAARNLGAEHCRTEQLVFLDVDCIPAKDFCEKMAAASGSKNALVMGSPRYMLGAMDIGIGMEECTDNSIFHPSRPLVNGIVREECYEMFWSLCFSIPKELFEHVGGFDNRYQGYGAEDTDFALEAKKAGIPFYLADAEVYHQQHPVYIPPLNHLEPIVKNCNLFYWKWGYWPMADCLKDFTDMGYIEWDLKRNVPIILMRRPSAHEVGERLAKNAPYR